MRMVAFLVFALLLSCGLARAEDNSKIVQGIIKQQIEAFRSDDGETAYSFAAPGIKSAFPDTQRFMEMVKNSYGPIYRPGNLTFGRNASEDDGRLMMQELLITDTNGETLAWDSAGTIGFKCARKATPFEATRAGESAGHKVRKMGMNEAEVRIKGSGGGREAAVTGVVSAGIRVTALEDHTPVPHNGCRPPKKRRV